MALGAFLLVFLQLTAASMDATTAAEGVQSPSCNRTCGEVLIPYPFGVGDGCYAEEYGNPYFNVSCNYSADPPRPFIGNNVNIHAISLGGQFRIEGRVAYDCYDREGNLEKSRKMMGLSLGFTGFRFSHTQNMFVVLGCDSYGYINGTEGVRYVGGCISTCRSTESVGEMGGNCSGVGCCETAIPRGLSTFIARIGSYSNHRNCWDFNPCGYAFLVEKRNFTFNVSDIGRGAGAYRDHAPPVVVDWSIGRQTCREVQASPDLIPYACHSDHSECFDSNVSGFGYNCRCKDGFEGNPYLLGGCRDIDECRLNSTICPSGGICTNTAGSYNCSCKDGFEWDPPSGCRDIDECLRNCTTCPRGAICTNTAGSYNCTCPPDTFAKDPMKDPCLPVPHTDALLFPLKMGLGLGLGIFLLMACLCGGYHRRKLAEQTRKVKEMKQKLFEQNGGPFLQELLSTSSSSSQTPAANTFRIFTEEELAAATNGFDEGQIVGRGGHGIVYRGRLQDDTEIAIKKSRMVNERQSKEFAREIGILSQINHVNVVKLLGCCLEVEIPMLVYQYVSCGTLYDFIHCARGVDDGLDDGASRGRWPTVISLATRMRIATEATEALAYLHSYASRPILHGDVKTSNILLDEHYTVKVSDFGASTTLAPVDEVQLATVVQGTSGYLDPEYLQTYRLTTKSDVYSFGVVLAELLTGKKPLQLQGSPEDERGLAVTFVSSLKSEKKLMQILDAQVVVEGEPEMLWEIAGLACRCLSMTGDDRPTMKEVVTALQVLRRPPERPWSSSGSTTLDEHATESESLLAGAESWPSDSTRSTNGGATATCYLSMQIE